MSVKWYSVEYCVVIPVRVCVCNVIQAQGPRAIVVVDVHLFFFRTICLLLSWM